MKASLIKTRPWCPFCGQDVGRPVEAVERKMDEFLLGECQCGAVYVSESTGYNVGSAIVECMVAACHDNADLAWELEPDVDYLSGRIEKYDEITHYVYESGEFEGRSINGLLYFIRLNKDFAELSTKLKEHKVEKSAKIKATALGSFQVPDMEPQLDPKRKKGRVNKQDVKKWVAENNIDALVASTFDNSKTLRFMQRLLYSPSEDERFFVAHIMGQVCRRVSTLQPGMISDVLHRMYESCTDSAAAHWGLIESIGCIIAARADLYGAFSRHLLMYRATDSSRAIVLWALGTIAKESPEAIRATPIYSVFSYINHEEATTRANAIRLFGRINAMEVRGKIEEALEDNTEVTVYENGFPKRTTISQLAKEAIDNMGIMSESGKVAPMTLGNATI